jgi:hypothetical protein
MDSDWIWCEFAGFEIATVGTIKIMIFWDVLFIIDIISWIALCRSPDNPELSSHHYKTSSYV